MNLQVDLDAPMTRAHALQRLSSQGFCTLNAASLAALVGVNLRELDALRPSWDDLPPDAYLKDGGRYRYRRHGCYVQAPGSAALEATPHRAHWQPTTYNALHGGMQRWFEPLDPALAGASAFTRLIASLGLLFAQAESNQGDGASQQSTQDRNHRFQAVPADRHGGQDPGPSPQARIRGSTRDC